MKFIFLVNTNPCFKITLKYHFYKYPLIKKKPPEFRLTEQSASKLELQDVNFAFEQAEKILINTVEDSEVLINRTSILLTITLSFIASFIGFIITESESEKTNWILVATSIIGICYLIFPTIKLIENFRGHKYQGIGSQPALLLDEYYVIEIPDNGKREVAIKLKEIKAYQGRINFNNSTNTIRWEKFNYSLKAMFYFPFLLASSYIFIKILSKLL